MKGTREGLVGSAILLIVLALIFTIISLVPKWRKGWGWGKGSGPPVSSSGFIGIIAAFLLMALSFLGQYFEVFQGAFWKFVLFFGGFVIFILAGIYDSLKARKKTHK